MQAAGGKTQAGRWILLVRGGGAAS